MIFSQKIDQKYALLFVGLILFCGTMIVLLGSVREEKTFKNGSWEVYFLDPHASDSLDFALENFGTGDRFTYTVSLGEKNILEKSITIPSGETKKEYIDEQNIQEPFAIMTIEVYDELGSKKSIYRKNKNE